VFNFSQESERELQSIDVELSKLQRHLEVCPKDGVTAVVDEASFVESILQLDQSRQRSRDLLQLTRASVDDRLERWKLFEDSVNRVLCLIKRLKYARNMATLKGSVDLQRLLSAKQSIEVSPSRFFSPLVNGEKEKEKNSRHNNVEPVYIVWIVVCPCWGGGRTLPPVPPPTEFGASSTNIFFAAKT
jgi:hypothetical protein